MNENDPIERSRQARANLKAKLRAVREAIEELIKYFEENGWPEK